MHALENNLDVEKEISRFFSDRYGAAGKEVENIMEQTESVQIKTFYMNGYYFTQGSYFPDVNQIKNHFWFEIMKNDCKIASDEWFIPIGWKRGEVADLLKEKEDAAKIAANLLDRVLALKTKIDGKAYEKLLVKFKNLDFVAKLWKTLAYAVYDYVAYFETKDEKYELSLKENLKIINEINENGLKELGKDFYNYNRTKGVCEKYFPDETLKTFEAEKVEYADVEKENFFDYVICGSALESHELKKEVNFSDTILTDNGEICRIAGNRAGLKWSMINAHGWFSYLLNLRKDVENEIVFTFGSATDFLSAEITIGDEKHVIKEKIDGKKDYAFKVKDGGDGKIRVRIDRLDANTPMLYAIKVR